MRWSAAQALAWIRVRKSLELKDWTRELGDKLPHAEEELANAIGDGRIKAWGVPKDDALLEPVPADPFRLWGVKVDPYGSMVPRKPMKPYQGPRWSRIEFEQDDIKRVWSAPPPITATDWMLKDAKSFQARSQIGKRDDMVKRCMAETGCKKREAEAAHAKLPEELRRKKGKPTKNIG